MKLTKARWNHNPVHMKEKRTMVNLKKSIPEFPLTISFDSAELRDLFRGWLSDGGGEQDFMTAVADERGTVLDIDYDSETLVVVNELPGAE